MEYRERILHNNVVLFAETASFERVLMIFYNVGLRTIGC